MQHEDIRSRSGDFLFRWRGHLPFLLVPVMIAAIALSHRPVQPRAVDLGWEVACVLLALAGWSIRVYTVGTAAPGTSGRNTRRQKANFLNVTGPYSVVRHPLYLANSLIALAFSLFTHTWILPVLMAVAAPLFYGSIARREEEYLRSRFGEAFEAWAARVPPIVPRLGGFVRSDRPFDWTAVRHHQGECGRVRADGGSRPRAVVSIDGHRAFADQNRDGEGRVARHLDPVGAGQGRVVGTVEAATQALG